MSCRCSRRRRAQVKESLPDVTRTHDSNRHLSSASKLKQMLTDMPKTLSLLCCSSIHEEELDAAVRNIMSGANSALRAMQRVGNVSFKV